MRAAAARPILIGVLLGGAASATVHCGPSKFEGLTGGAAKDGGKSDSAAPPAPPAPPAGSCEDTCFAQHPDALLLDDQLFGCWQLRCVATCIDRQTSAEEQTDAGGAPACSRDFVAPKTNTPCADCSRLRCCDPWNACFSDPGCRSLDECIKACR